ncbi:tyrosine-type recombinase/integrase [Brachybacterium tyrofermentans]|uniref:tyrosine-type recombinase/integrase n=1 Tax=Brachybacterium tyrofermentans TaxID=47848 RepID=UPI003FD30F98
MTPPSRKHPATPSTLRGYHSIIRLFCDYLTDPRYRWATDCDERFGSTPQQICHEWNTLAHLVDYEGRPQRRALTYDELEHLFTVADHRVETILQRGRKGALTALRDSQILKTIYAYGLRRAEAVGLDVADLRPNGAAPRFGRFGAVDVRWGKGAHGSGPRRRSVLTIPELDWITEGLAQWIDHARPRFTTGSAGPLWLTERGTRVSLRYIDLRFAQLRDEAELPSDLSVHALRHTYVTNLIEWGYAEKFVQDQVGHVYASTTAIYTSVGDDFKNRMINQALFRIYGGPDDEDPRP